MTVPLKTNKGTRSPIFLATSYEMRTLIFRHILKKQVTKFFNPKIEVNFKVMDSEMLKPKVSDLPFDVFHGDSLRVFPIVFPRLTAVVSHKLKISASLGSKFTSWRFRVIKPIPNLSVGSWSVLSHVFNSPFSYSHLFSYPMKYGWVAISNQQRYSSWLYSVHRWSTWHDKSEETFCIKPVNWWHLRVGRLFPLGIIRFPKVSAMMSF